MIPVCARVTTIVMAAIFLGAISTLAADLLPELAPYKGPSLNDVDATTIKGKVMCGYQMWFRTPGDGVKNAWVHWSGGRDVIGPGILLVEMWPDMSEYLQSEKCPASDMKHKDGSQAYLFSSARPAVVDLHFKWMRDYGIDGVFVQRFLCGCGEPNTLNTTGPLAYARNAANKTGRVFALTYDLSGTETDKIMDMLIADWKFLVDEVKITQDKRYLHEGGKPVLEIYGFFPDRFPPSVANKIIDFFKNDPKYGVFLVGSGAWWWRTIEDPEWVKAFRRFDAIKPWNVGNWAEKDGIKTANMNYWADDLAEAHKHNILYMPVVYPGFSWDNLMRAYNQPQNAGNPLPRRGGEFFWEQFVKATQLGVDTIFVAMFDEVDEGTAIFKVTNDPPTPGHFVTYEGKPSDWYLRLTGRGTRMFRKEIPLSTAMPRDP